VFIGFIDEDGGGSGLQVNLKGPFCFLGMTFLDKKCGCRNSYEVSVGSCITNPFVFLSYPALLLSYKDPMCLLHSRNREVVQYFCHFVPFFQDVMIEIIEANFHLGSRVDTGVLCLSYSGGHVWTGIGEGDRNTKKIHRKAAWRAKKNKIKMLKENGQFTVDGKEIEWTATSYCKKLYSKDPNVCPIKLLELLPAARRDYAGVERRLLSHFLGPRNL
jgi:hypothetical protein